MKRKYVYIIRIINTRYYKIGISNNVENRLKELNTATPFELRIEFKKQFKDFYLIENYIQNTFINKHLRGEWFELSIYDINSIKSFLSNFENKEQLKTEVNKRLVSSKKHQKNNLKSAIIFERVHLSPKSQDMSKEWSIIYYAKQKPKDNYKRFRVKGGMNRVKNKAERLIFADDLKFHIIRILESGYNPFENNGKTITNYSP